MKSITSFVITIVTIYMALDVMVFIAWALSGQFPVDDFYVGAVTTTIIKSILTLF